MINNDYNDGDGDDDVADNICNWYCTYMDVLRQTDNPEQVNEVDGDHKDVGRADIDNKTCLFPQLQDPTERNITKKKKKNKKK